MPVRVDNHEKVVTAYLEGEIDHHGAAGIRDLIDRTVEQAMPEQLILDFRDVTFMDSSGIGLVMGRYRIMKELGGCIQVVNTSPHITRVMKLAGLERLDVLSKGGKTK